jgi:hypothetical protein
MKKAVAVCVALVALILPAQARQITGQVFVITKAHESVKLGLVPIGVYPRDQIQSVIENTDSELNEDRRKIKDLMNSIHNAYIIAEKMHDRLWAEATSSSYDRNRYNAARSALNLQKEISHLETAAMRRSHYLQGSSIYFKKLAEYHPIATTKTDADGEFSIEVPGSGDLAIVAVAQRQTPNSVENYFWIVPAADHVDLSNDNLTSATAGASILHVIGNDDRADSRVTEDAIIAEFEKLKSKYADIFAATPPKQLPQRNVTLKQAVSMQIQHGTVVLPAGTQLEFISSDASEVHVRYMGSEQAIPISAVEFK